MSSSQGQGPSGQGPYNLIGRNSAFGSMYRAFEDYEQQARQRKYLIAELEDTLANVEKELKEVIERNKAKEVECEKLEIAAQAAEANYEKKVKEKELMENNYRELSKEMDEVMAEIAKKKDQVNHAAVFRQQKLDLIAKTEERYLKEYKKNPKCAVALELSNKVAELDSILKGKNQELDRRRREQRELRKKRDEEFENFKKKCVRTAELYAELKKKVEVRNGLKKQLESMFKTPTTAAIRRLQLINKQQSQSQSVAPTSASQRVTVVPVSPFPANPSKMDGTVRTAVSSPHRRRSSTFQQLDNLMYRSNSVRGSLAERRTTVTAPAGSNSPWKNFCSPMKSGQTLVSQLRSKLKGTVRPMPRSQDSGPERNATPSQVATIAAISQPQAKNEQNENATCLPPVQSGSTIATAEMDVQHPQAQDKATTSHSGHSEFLLPPQPPTRPHQQNVATNSKPTEGNDDKSFSGVPSQQQTPIAEQTKSDAATTVATNSSDLMDTSEPTQKSQVDISTQGSSSSSFSFKMPHCMTSQGSGTSFLDGFQSSPNQAGAFFDGFFGSTNPTDPKSPTFNFSIF